MIPQIDAMLLLGGIFLTLGLLTRILAVRQDARQLKAADRADRPEGLRGAYVGMRLGAAMLAVGLATILQAVSGTPALALALLLAPPVLVLSELLPRALTPSPSAPATAEASWSHWLGRSLEPIEETLTGAEHETWTHQGLTPLVRIASTGEDTDQGTMARRVYDFGEVTLSDIMVPLVNVIAVREDSPLEEVIRIANREQVSRLPVFRERIPNIVGILHVFDLLVPNGARKASERMNPPTFVPEMALASDILRRLQVEGVNLAIVVDEYGGAVGIVTIEDILEEVVGEIEDEYDEATDHIREDGSGWVVDARAEIERLNEQFSWRLPEGDYETLGGLLLARLARIPAPQEKLVLDRVVLEVTRSSARAVQEVAVRLRGDATEEESQ